MHNIYEEHIKKDSPMPFSYHLDKRLPEEKYYHERNWHSNMEILSCVEGNGYVVCDDQKYEFGAGDIAVIEPLAFHNIITTGNKLKYHCVILDEHFFVQNSIDLNKIVFSSVIKDKEIFNKIQEISKLYKSEDEFRVIKCKILVYEIILLMYKNHASKDTSKYKERKYHIDRINKIIIYIRQNYSQKITLEKIAAECNINKNYLSREFKKFTDKTIFEYITIVRCKEAKKRIKEGMSIANAMYECGYTNTSYFAKTYKKVMGKFPSEDKIE